MENKDVVYEFKKKNRVKASNFAFMMMVFSAVITGVLAKDFAAGIAVLSALLAIGILIKLAEAEIIDAIEKK